MEDTFDKGVERKGTDCIKWDFQKADYGREGLLPFSIADADWPTFAPVLTALKKRIDTGVIGYTDISDSYLSAVTGWCRRRHHWSVEKEWIVPTGGIVPALCNCIEAFTNPGDKVIVQPPVYDPFYSIVHASKRQVCLNPLIHDVSGYHMDYEDLEKWCRQGARILILCSPHNPVCRVWTAEELQKVTDICRKYHVIILSDEIHWDLILGDIPHTTMGTFTEIQDQLVVCTSCSKTFNLAGLQTSNLIIPGKKLRSLLQDYLYSRYLFCPNTLGLLATQTAYESGDAWVDQELAYLRKNARYVQEYLEENLPEVKLARVEGTYLLWMDMRSYGKDSEELVKRIAEEGAGLNAGNHYGKDYDGFVRMNIACPLKQLKAGLQCIEKALKKIEEE